jgi:hypothetical protein
MTGCKCPVAGYCQRHKVSKATGWHKLCQTKPAYFDAWEDGRGPGQDRSADDARRQRRQKVAEAKEKQKRLVGWLHFFRLPTDRGIGDTATRLLTSTKPATDARRELERLLAKCSCSRVDAVERLNREHGW